MTNPLIKIYDVETDTTTEREMTDAEFKAWDDGNKAKAAKDAAEIAKRTAAEAKLAALGLTTDDLKALGLGGN
jgi:hypothetical protein